MQDEASQVQWYKLLLCDTALSTPGLRESIALKEGTPLRKDAPKNRNLIVPWQALRVALEAAVDTAGDMGAYRQRWVDGTWWWLATADNATVPGGPSFYNTCVKARQQGLIP